LTCDNKRYRQVAEETCEFLLTNTFNGEHFSFIGCNGWYERGQTRATFDQQPLEAASTVMMLRAAFDATADDRFLRLQRKAFDWFLGANDVRVALYDFRTRGCNDGLHRDGVNTNQGAESTISFFLSLLAMVESYATVEKTKVGRSAPLLQVDIAEPNVKKKHAIKAIATKTRAADKQIEEVT